MTKCFLVNCFVCDTQLENMEKQIKKQKQGTDLKEFSLNTVNSEFVQHGK